MTYLPLTLPTDPTARARRITFERAQGGHIYQRPDGSYVLARETWPMPSSPGTTILSIPGDWTEIT